MRLHPPPLTPPPPPPYFGVPPAGDGALCGAAHRQEPLRGAGGAGGGRRRPGLGAGARHRAPGQRGQQEHLLRDLHRRCAPGGKSGGSGGVAGRLAGIAPRGVWGIGWGRASVRGGVLRGRGGGASGVPPPPPLGDAVAAGRRGAWRGGGLHHGPQRAPGDGGADVGGPRGRHLPLHLPPHGRGAPRRPRGLRGSPHPQEPLQRHRGAG